MGRASRNQKVATYLSSAGALVLVSIVLVLPVAAGAQTMPVIDGLMTEIAGQIQAISVQAGGDAAKVETGCGDFLGRYLNLEALAQAASEDAWNRMSATQREAYRGGLAHRLALECTRELAGYKGEPIMLMGIRQAAGGDNLATQRLGSAENGRMIAWRVHRAEDGTLRVTDVIWEGHSAVAKARDEFAAVLQGAKGNIDTVIEAISK
jgi:ABC-type transporter MlaC component